MGIIFSFWPVGSIRGLSRGCALKQKPGRDVVVDSEAGPFHRPRPKMWQNSPSCRDDLTSWIHTSHFFHLILTKSDSEVA